MCNFGADAYVHVPDQLCKKLDAKAKKGIMMDYNITSKAYRIWDNTSQKFIESRDVLFDEEFLPTDASGLSIVGAVASDLASLTIRRESPLSPPRVLTILDQPSSQLGRDIIPEPLEDVGVTPINNPPTVAANVAILPSKHTDNVDSTLQ